MTISDDEKTTKPGASKFEARGQCYNTFYSRKLRLFITS
jgi:hypothetical protein